MGLNNCHFIGNVGRDPEARAFPNGDQIVNLSIGVSETWKDKQTGEKKERTEWIPLVFTGPLVKVVLDWVKKGSQIYVAGKFTTRKWADKDGVDRYSTEVRVSELQLLGKREGGGQQQSAPAQQRAPAPQRQASADLDDIPF